MMPPHIYLPLKRGEPMELKKATDVELGFIKTLYFRAFPSQERKPFTLIRRQRAKGLLEVWTASDGGIPVGFAITAVSDSLVLLDYLAVSDVHRSKGLGSSILRALAEIYGDTPIFLEIEKPDIHAKNQSERLARKAFYLRNGYREAGINVLLWGVKMEILTTADSLTFAECDRIYDRIYGTRHSQIIRELHL